MDKLSNKVKETVKVLTDKYGELKNYEIKEQVVVIFEDGLKFEISDDYIHITSHDSMLNHLDIINDKKVPVPCSPQAVRIG